MDLDASYNQYQTDRDLDALLTSVRSYAVAKASKRKMPDPESLAQDIVVRVWQTFHSFDSRRGHFRAWVARLTTNYLNTCHRSAKRQIMAEQEPEDRPLDTLDVAFVDEDQPERDLSLLPKQVQKIAALLTLGYDKTDVAVRMGCSVRTVERIIEHHVESLKAA